MTTPLKRTHSAFVTHGRHCTCSACAREDWTNADLAPCGMHGEDCPALYQPLAGAGELVPGTERHRNLLSDLSSLGRMNRRDQRMLDMRLRVLSGEAKRHGAISLAADLLRATYELDTADFG